MRMSMLPRPKIRSTAFVAAIATTIASGATAAGATTEPIPQCTLKALQEAQPTLDLSQLEGKVGYVDFWASWCGPCAQSFPFMNQLHQDLHERGLEVVGISVDESAADAKNFLAKRPAQFPVAIDSSGACPSAFQVKGMPTTYLVDRRGNIRHVHVGFRAGDAATLRALTEQLLAEDQVSAK